MRKILFIMIIQFAAVTSINAQFSGGSGDSSDDPYLISNVSDLATLATNVNSGTTYSGKFFKQTADLDLSSYNTGSGWPIIGNSIGKSFQGVYDGDNHSITELYISSTQYFVGLFGQVFGGTVKNLHLIDVNVSGGGFATGSLVGYLNSYSSVTGSSSSGTVTAGSGNRAGGLVGQVINFSYVTDSYSSANVSGSTAGGIASDLSSNQSGSGGTLPDVYIRRCFSTGNVTGTSLVGGIVGNIDDYCEVTNCFATGIITGTTAIGGIAGNIVLGGYNATLVNNYFTGKLNGPTGLVIVNDKATNTNGTYVIDNLWDSDLSGLSQVSDPIYGHAGLARTTEQMKNVDYYTKFEISGSANIASFIFDFVGNPNNDNNNNDYWDIDVTKNGGYPYFATWQTFPSNTTLTDGNSFTPSITSGSTDQVIGQFNLNSSASNTILNALWITLYGSQTRSGYSNFKLWESTDDTFGGDTQIGTTFSTDPGYGEKIWFSSLNETLPQNTTVYYFLTCDVDPSPSGTVGPVLRENQDIQLINSSLNSSLNYTELASGARPLIFSGGNGDLNDPFLIATVVDLKTLADNIESGTDYSGKYFKQTENIDLNVSPYNTGTGWVMIGKDNTKPFVSSYDGNNKTISNLFIDNSSASYSGLFGYVSGGTITNLGITNVNIANGGSKTGALAGYIENATVTNCYSAGTTVTGNNFSSYTGGLMGDASNVILSDSYSTCPVSKGNYVGGIAGKVLKGSGGSISNVNYTGSLSYGIYVGGIVGINGNPSISGLGADMTGVETTVTITNSTVASTGSSTTIGGITGRNGGDITNATASVTITGGDGIGGIVGTNDGGKTIGNSGSTGTILASLNASTNAGGFVNANSGTIQNCYSYVDVSSDNGGGFVNDNTGTISNSFSTGNVTGSVSGYFTGGFVGLNRGTINSCYSTGNVASSSTVNAANSGFGGFAGLAYGAQFNNCYSTGSTTALTKIGGFLGNYLNVSTFTLVIENCYSLGSASGGTPNGGLIGNTTNAWNDTYGTVTNSYWNTETSGLSTTASNKGTGKTTAEMKNSTTFTSWDFTNTWDRNDNKNGGFPFLKWQSFPNTIALTNGSSFNPSTTAGQNNQAIGRIALTTDQSEAVFNAIWIKLGGTSRDGEASNFKLWESSNDAFNSSEDTQIGSTVAADPGVDGTIYFSSLNSKINTSAKYYFLTCDIAGGATGTITPTIVAQKDMMLTYGLLSAVISNTPMSGGAVPLPVEITSFEGFNTKNIVELNWQTATEVDNYGFEIQRKSNLRGHQGVSGNSDLEGYTKIGFVQGAGNSNSPKEYSFVDDEPIGGKITYRLKQIDTDGNFEYSDEIEVEVDIPEKFALYQNYPNPFNPSTKIEFAIPEKGFTTLSVYDAIGNEIRKLVNEELSPGKYEIKFDASGLSSGIYYYQLKAGKFISTKKMILLK